jgi:hypothetical protein
MRDLEKGEDEEPSEDNINKNIRGDSKLWRAASVV